MSYYTENLVEFGIREREMAAVLLLAGLPENFSDDGVKLAFNKSSGNVFLINEEYQVAMMNGDEIEIFYSTPYESLEGFIGDLMAENKAENKAEDLAQEDIDFILEMAKRDGAELPDLWKAADSEVRLIGLDAA